MDRHRMGYRSNLGRLGRTLSRTNGARCGVQQVLLPLRHRSGSWSALLRLLRLHGLAFARPLDPPVWRLYAVLHLFARGLNYFL
jgi:hypothetical protein